MSNIKKGSKLTVSTGNGISRASSNNLGVLELSGPGLANVVSQDSTFSLASSNVPQLSIGAIDNSGIFQLGLDNQGNAILEATQNGANNNILIQQLGGYVGIGTDNPASTLHVNSTDALIIPVGTNTNRPGESGQITAQKGMIRYNDESKQFEGYGPGSAWGSLGGVKDVDGDTYILAETSAGADNDALQFFTASGERMIIDSSGYVGIGISNPAYTLDVNGTAYFRSTTTFNSITYLNSTTYLSSYITHNGDTNTNFGFPATDTFVVRTNGGDRLYINSSGYVGIGISNPAYTLDVNGTAYFRSTTTFNSITYLNSTTYLSSYITHNGDTNTNFGFPATDTFVVRTNGTDRLYINSSGNVEVEGNITTSTGYPYYQSLGTENIVNPPSTTRTVYGVNITAMNKRTRASYASAEACVETWTDRSAAEANGWYSVCWSPELSIFVAVSYGGTNRVMTSPDGITWTARSAAEANSWWSVCWSPELSLFVALSYNGTNRVMTSPNGITWTARSAAAANGWSSVCWSPELSIFVAVSYDGTNRVMTSPNGITWTARSAASSSWFSVCWSPEFSLFVAVGSSAVMTSPDGITWTVRSVVSSNWVSVCWSPELSLFVAVAWGGTNKIMTSPNGITWTARSAAEGNRWRSVCWSPELSIFVAVSNDGTNRVMTSPDGFTWTARSAGASSWYSVCWSPELSIFVAVADGGTYRVMTSNIGMPNSKSVVKALPTQMSVLPDGKVGIGTTSPTDKLEIRNNNSQLRLTDSDDNSYAQLSLSSSMLAIRINSTSSTSDVYIRSGKVGIGTTSPTNGKFEVSGYVNKSLSARYYNSSGGSNYWNNHTRALSAYFSNHIACQELQVFSDRRIKKNIVDVSDNQALEMVRDIPCRYYEYRDTISKGQGKTIGFIAQEVKERMPMAVSFVTQIIPNEMRDLSDISWNNTTLYTDLSDCSGIKYRFYVSNDISDNETMKEVVGNSDNSFTFDNSYNNVFCYGKEVDDFHTVDKNKLFALNFSATQEIDRIQQQQIIDISNANATIQTHETTIQTLQTDLSNANTTIQQQETTIQQQATTIQTLETQIANILTRLSNLENTGSA